MKLEISDVTVSLGGREILRNLNFIHDSGVTMILGPNGCGKSTLLRSIMGFLPLSKGRICLDGKDIRTLSRRSHAALISYLPQRQITGIAMDMLEYVALGESPRLSAFSTPGDDALQRADILLASMRLAHLARRSMDEISLGELRLAGLARMRMQRAGLILLDEPLAGLDFQRKYEFLHALDSIDESVIMTIHEPDAACAHGDRILLMESSGSYQTFEMRNADPSALAAALSRTYGMTLRFQNVNGRQMLISDAF